MATNRSAGQRPESNRANSSNDQQPSYRWSTYYQGPVQDLSQPGFEYVAHPHVNDGPDPPRPSSSLSSLSARQPRYGRKLEAKPILPAGWEEEILPTSKPRHTSFRKLARNLSYKLLGKKPKVKDAAKPEPLFAPDTLLDLNKDPELGDQKTPFTLEKNLYYCKMCELTYLVGKAGQKYAELHPHHFSALTDKRSLAVFATVGSAPDGKGQRKSIANYTFGPSSGFNLETYAEPFANSDEAMAYNHRDCLKHVVEKVLPQRKDMAIRAQKVTSNPLLQPVPWKCRIIMFAHLRGSQSIDATDGELKNLADYLKHVASLGIEVKWCDLDSLPDPTPDRPYDF